MKKTIIIDFKIYTPDQWLRIYIDSRSSTRYQGAVDEIKEVFDATDKEAMEFVNNFTKEI